MDGKDFYLEIDLTGTDYQIDEKEKKILVKLNSWHGCIEVKSFSDPNDEHEKTFPKSWKSIGVGDRGGILMW